MPFLIIKSPKNIPFLHYIVLYACELKGFSFEDNLLLCIFVAIKPADMTVYISLEPYLAQWLKHECGGTDPIRLKRASAEADILEYFLRLRPKRKNFFPQMKPKEGQTAILVPHFKYKDTRSHNYLPPRAEIVLHACIKNRFNVQLWKDLYTIENQNKRIDQLIYHWMRAHGIEECEKNWNTIAKIYQRKRAVYCSSNRLTNNKSRKKTEN